MRWFINNKFSRNIKPTIKETLEDQYLLIRVLESGALYGINI